ncbi:MAG: ferrous iron transport protein B, partial [Candidatus Omnitrophica bacterium]|nr:ferrous iron transport protein B [Candidatus Omnitrophota bacterium]
MPDVPLIHPATEKRAITVVLAGNPNSGKTTVFNALTKMRQKVGNYAGVTVEKKLGRIVYSDQHETDVLDLPGTYSLDVRSPDEKVARDVLLGHMRDTLRPDIVVCIVDATNLERNLYLFSQVQDLGLPVVIFLNMMDEVEQQGKKIDVAKLSEVLRVPVIAGVANQGKGIEELKDLIRVGVKPVDRRLWRMPEQVEARIEELMILLWREEKVAKSDAFSESLILLSKDEKALKDILKDRAKVIQCVRNIQADLTEWGINWRSVAIESRYDWLSKSLKGVYQEKSGARQVTMTDKIDAIVTHKVWGWLIFLGLMALMFYSIFTISTYPMDAIDSFFSQVSGALKNVMPEGDLRDLITDGVIAGVGGVVIFLPQILILFFFIGLLQDTGYMARAAFIMDRLMRGAGLHGKSFIPMLSSFACAIPGVMAARAIESPKDRLTTILVSPLMSCSARLPVYTIIIAVLIPGALAWEKAGLMLALYLFGIVGAFGMAFVFKKTLLRSETPVFIMELPPYRLPLFKDVMMHMWERAVIFLKRAGTVIFVLSIILWALMTYPKHEHLSPSEALKQSIAGQAGILLEPAIKPLGYDWRIGIGLIGSFAAREVFVSTMNIVFNIESEGEDDHLREAFVKATWPDGRPLFTPLTCISLMLFYVFAMQCISTVAVVRRETNSWRWPLFQIV